MSKKILVVDDDVAFCTMLQTFLKKKGFEVTSIFTGKDAIDTIDKNSFDVIITDIRLPDSDGMEILKKSKEKIKFMPIRAENVDVPMIMSSIKYLDLYTMGMETIKTQIVDIISGYENNDRYATYQNIHAYALVTKINEVKFFLVAKKFFEPNGKFVVATTLNEKEASFTCSNFMYTHGFNPNVIEIDGKEHNAFLIDIPEGIKKGFKVETTFSSKFDRYENIRLLHLISDKKLANVEIIKINKESDIPNL